jgi:DNA polymerase I
MDNLTPFEFDMALQAPVFQMERRGILIDFDARDRYKEQAHENWQKYQSMLNQVAGGELNVNSPKQVKEFLYSHLGLPGRRHKGKLSTKEEKLRSLMAECQDKVNSLVQESAIERWRLGLIAITLILKIRGVRKKLSSYLEVDFDTDGRCRTNLSVGKTETGRFSSSKTLWGTGLNLQTVPKSLRDMYIADEGKELAELDLNRGESWVYAHLSGDHELLRIHLDGLDFHSETAAGIARAFGADPLPADEIARRAKAGDDFAFKLRYLGKRVNHASAYRMGPFRQAEVVNNDADETGITITVGEAKKAQAYWKMKYPGMVEWWNRIEMSLNEDRILRTPYGRERIFYAAWGNELFKEATAYIPQSTSVDYLNRGMLRVWNELVLKDFRGLEILHQNHDAILIQYDSDHRDEVLSEVSSRLISTLVINDREFSIPVEAEYGQNWKEMTEWVR